MARYGLVLLAASVTVVLLLADGAAAQTFSYSRGWKSGKRAVGAAGAALPPAAAAAALGGRPAPADDILAEDLPLYRYFLEGRGEHRVPYDPWRLVEDPVLHLVRRPGLPQSGEQAGEHDDR